MPNERGNFYHEPQNNSHPERSEARCFSIETSEVEGCHAHNMLRLRSTQELAELRSA